MVRELEKMPVMMMSPNLEVFVEPQTSHIKTIDQSVPSSPRVKY